MKLKYKKEIVKIRLYLDNMFYKWGIIIFDDDDYDRGGVNHFIAKWFSKLGLYHLNIFLVKPEGLIEIDYENLFNDMFFYNHISFGFVRIGFTTSCKKSPNEKGFYFKF